MAKGLTPNPKRAEMYNGKPSKGVKQPGDGGLFSGKADPFNDLGNTRVEPVRSAKSSQFDESRNRPIKKTPDMTGKSGGIGRKKK